MTRTASQKARAKANVRAKKLVASRRAPTMRGRGGFFQDIGRKIFEDGDLERAGSWIGRKLPKLLGFGDYTIRKNSIVSHLPIDADGNVTTKEFSFSDYGAASIMVRKREYLGAINAPDDKPENFALTSYRLQPTDEATFPWLSALAGSFTEWELKGAIVSYETTSSNFSSTVGLGTIGIATQYNANMLPYSSMDSILQSAFLRLQPAGLQ